MVGRLLVPLQPFPLHLNQRRLVAEVNRAGLFAILSGHQKSGCFMLRRWRNRRENERQDQAADSRVAEPSAVLLAHRLCF